MPDRLVETLSTWREQIVHAALFSIIGISIGLGKLLASEERLTPRIVIGRALSTGGLAMAAGLALAWMPDLPLIAQMGLAATLASLGTSGLERVFQRALQGRIG